MHQKHLRFAMAAVVIAMGLYACNTVVDPEGSAPGGDIEAGVLEASAPSAPTDDGTPDSPTSDAGTPGSDASTASDASTPPVASDASLDGAPAILEPVTPCRKIYGGRANEYSSHVAIDRVGNVAILFDSEGINAGGHPLPTVSEVIDLGGGVLANGPLVSFDSSCEVRWSRPLPLPYVAPRAISYAPSGHLWVLQTSNNTHQLTEIDTGGNDVRVIQLPASASKMVVDGGGNILLQGGFTGTVDLGGGPATIGPSGGFFVMKLDPNGAYAWSTVVPWGTANSPVSVGIQAAPNGDVIIGGRHRGVFDLGGGGIPLPAPPSGQTNAYLLRFDAATGAIAWAQPWMTPGAGFDSFAVDGIGEIYVAGSALPNINAMRPFVAKRSGAGTLVWTSTTNAIEIDVGPIVGRAAGAYLTLVKKELWYKPQYAKVVPIDPAGVPPSAFSPAVLSVGYSRDASLSDTSKPSLLLRALATAADDRLVAAGSFQGRLSVGIGTSTLPGATSKLSLPDLHTPSHQFQGSDGFMVMRP